MTRPIKNYASFWPVERFFDAFALVGMLSSLIGVFSAWPAGTMFAILLANMFAPITDHAIRQWQGRASATSASVPAGGSP